MFCGANSGGDDDFEQLIFGVSGAQAVDIGFGEAIRMGADSGDQVREIGRRPTGGDGFAQGGRATARPGHNRSVGGSLQREKGSGFGHKHRTGSDTAARGNGSTGRVARQLVTGVDTKRLGALR